MMRKNKIHVCFLFFLFLVVQAFPASLYEKREVENFVTLIESTDGRNTGFSWSLSYDPENNNSREVYLSIDISGITKPVSSASLFINVMQDQAMNPSVLDNYWLGLHAVTDDNIWETDFTWSNKPNYDPEALAYINVQNTERQNFRFRSPDLTENINLAITQGDSLISFALRGRDSLPGYRLYGRHIEANGIVRTELEMSFTERPQLNSPVSFLNLLENNDSSSFENEWEVSFNETGNNSKEVLLKFDISHLNQDPNHVALKFAASLGVGNENDKMQLLLYGVDDTEWNDSITWSSRPSADTLLASVLINTEGELSSYGFSNTGLFDYIQEALDQNQDSVSFLIRADSGYSADVVSGVFDQLYLSFEFSPRPADKSVHSAVTIVQEGDTNMLGDRWHVINSSNAGKSKQMIMKFDLSDVSAQIKDATLEIYVKQGDTGNVDTLQNYDLQLFAFDTEGWNLEDFIWSDLIPPTLQLASTNVSNLDFALHSIRNDELIAYLNNALNKGLDSVAFLLKSPNQTPGIQVTGLHNKTRLRLAFDPPYTTQHTHTHLTVFEQNDSASANLQWHVYNNNTGIDKETFFSFLIEGNNQLADSVIIQILAKQDTLTGGNLQEEYHLDLYLVEHAPENNTTWSNRPAETTLLASAIVSDDKEHQYIQFISDELTEAYNSALLTGNSLFSLSIKGSNEVSGAFVSGLHDFTVLGIDITPPEKSKEQVMNVTVIEQDNSGESLDSWTVKSGENKRIEYVQFFIGDINHSADKVNLKLTVKHNAPIPASIALYASDNSWDESTVWNTKPLLDTVSIAVTEVPNGSNYAEVIFTGLDLRNAINDALSSGKEYVSFAILSEEEGDVELEGLHADGGTMLDISFTLMPKLSEPQVSPVSGTFLEDSIYITITPNDPNDRLFYTLNGSEPDINSMVYRKPILIVNEEQQVTLRVKAYQFGKILSDELEHTYNMTVPTTGYGMGPGGVGFPDITVEGQPELGLWLKANAISGVNDGNVVDLWEDLSGNDNHATSAYANKQPEGYYEKIKPPPTYHTDCINGWPCLNMGTNQNDKKALVVPDAPNLDGGPGLGIFLVFERNVLTDPDIPGGDWQRMFEKRQFYTPGYSDYSWVIEISGQVDANQVKATINGTNVIDSRSQLLQTHYPYLIAHNHDKTVNYLYINGVLDNFNNYSEDVMRGTANVVIGNAAKINLAEVVYFNEGLNFAQFTIVQNALSAKYGIEIPEPEETLFNPPVKRYTNEIIGIGKRFYFDDPGEELHEHISSSGGYLYLSEANESFGNGDFVFAGHNGSKNWIDDTWSRVWFVDVTGNVDVRLAFDLDAAGLTEQLNSDLNLWYRESIDEEWNAIASSPSISNGRASFTVSGLTQGFYGIGKTEPIGITTHTIDDVLFKVYPNPVSDKIFIESSHDQNEILHVALFSINGTKILSQSFTQNIVSVDVNTIACGIYFMRMQQGEYVSYEKIIIK